LSYKTVQSTVFFDSLIRLFGPDFFVSIASCLRLTELYPPFINSNRPFAHSFFTKRLFGFIFIRKLKTHTSKSKKMHTSKIAVSCSSLVGMAGCFMPWAQQLFFGRTGSIAGITYAEGLFCLVYFGILVLCCFLKDTHLSWSNGMAAGIALTTLIPGALTWYKVLEFQNNAAKMRGFNVDINSYVIYDPAAGLYTTIAAIIIVLVVSLTTVLLSRKSVFIPDTWIKAQPARRFFIASSN
jgi:hypothetical protein